MIHTGNLRLYQELVIIGILIYLMARYVSLLLQIIKRKKEIISAVAVLSTYKIDNKHGDILVGQKFAKDKTPHIKIEYEIYQQ